MVTVEMCIKIYVSIRFVFEFIALLLFLVNVVKWITTPIILSH